MFRIPLVHHHGDDEMAKHRHDKAKEESKEMKHEDPKHIPQESMKSFLYIWSPRYPICLKTYYLLSSQEYGYTMYRGEIPGPPILQDPQPDLELADVLGRFSTLLSCLLSQSKSLL